MMLKVPHKHWDKLFYFVDKSPVEISFFGRMKLVDEGVNYELTNLYLIDQVNHSTETEIDDVALGKLMYSSKDDEGFLNCWIHSHVNMSTEWSGTDVDTTKRIGKNGFCLSLCVNKRRETRCAYYQGSDEFKPAIYADNLKVEMVYLREEGKAGEWDKEYTAKCKKFERKPYIPGRSFGQHNGFQKWERDFPVWRSAKGELAMVRLANQKDLDNWAVTQGLMTRKEIDNQDNGVSLRRMLKKDILKDVDIPNKEKNIWWKKFCKSKGLAPFDTLELEIFYWQETDDFFEDLEGNIAAVGRQEEYIKDSEGYIVGIK